MSQTCRFSAILSTVSPLSESAAYSGMDDGFGVDLTHLPMDIPTAGIGAELPITLPATVGRLC
jgi:hypothetical protein